MFIGFATAGGTANMGMEPLAVGSRPDLYNLANI